MPCLNDKNGNKVIKAYNYTLILYQDSCVEDYAEILQNMGLKVVISPWHDKDIGEDGNLLKPHKHVCIFLENQQRPSYVEDIVEKINAYAYFEKLDKPNDMINYLTHDSYKGTNKEKYSKDDIEWINCIEEDFYKRYYYEIIRYIDSNKIKSFTKLVKKLSADKEYNLLEYISKNTFYIKTYIDGIYKDEEKELNMKRDYIENLIKTYEIDGTMNVDVLIKLKELFYG